MKQILALILAAILVFSLVGCGETDGGAPPAGSAKPPVGGIGSTSPSSADQPGQTAPSEEPEVGWTDPQPVALTAEEAIAGADVLKSGSCGESVTFAVYSNGALIISGTGDMSDDLYERSGDSKLWPEYKKDIKTIVIEDGVTHLGHYAFGRLYELKTLVIPASVTSIGSMAFFNDSKLDYLYLPEGIVHIGEKAFGACGFSTVAIPSSVTELEPSAFGQCSGLKRITVHPDNPQYSAEDGVLYSKDGSALLQFPSGKALENGTFRIPDQVVEIGAYAFYYRDWLTSIELPAGVKTIGKCAFYGCEKLSSVSLPEGLSAIGDSAFDRAISLTQVTIPRSVASIGESAFASNPNLKDIYYTGTEAEWSAIEIKEYGNSHLLKPGTEHTANLHFAG